MLLSSMKDFELCGPEWSALIAVNSAELMRMLKASELDEVRYGPNDSATRHALGPNDEERLLELLRHSFPVRLDYSEQQLLVCPMLICPRCVVSQQFRCARRPLPRR